MSYSTQYVISREESKNSKPGKKNYGLFSEGKRSRSKKKQWRGIVSNEELELFQKLARVACAAAGESVDYYDDGRDGVKPEIRSAICMALTSRELYGWGRSYAGDVMGLDRTSLLYFKRTHNKRYAEKPVYRTIYDAVYDYAAVDCNIFGSMPSTWDIVIAINKLIKPGPKTEIIQL